MFRNIKCLLIVYFICLHLFVVALSVLFLKSKGQLERYKGQYYTQTLAFQKRVDANLAPGYVAFIGDSHIQGLAVQEIYPKSVNYGIGADTTEGVLKRLPEYRSLDEAKVIVLLIGFNDLKRSSDAEIVKNIRRIISSISLKKSILLSLLLPIDESKVSIPGITNIRIRHLNVQLANLANDYANIKIVDTNSSLGNDAGSLSNLYDAGDGIHLNAAGNAVLIDKIGIELKPFLNKDSVSDYGQ